MSRYARQIALPAFGEEGQSKLTKARVLVVGAGGLAASALPLLAGAGLGSITIIDPDQVDLSNLHRQHLFTEVDCGSNKAEIAIRRCQALNSDIALVAITAALTPRNAPDLVAQADLVLDCADSYAVSYTLSDVCLAAKIPLITASAIGLEGYVAGVCGAAPSLRAIFPDPPDSAATCAGSGVLGPVVSSLGALQAQMAIAHLAGFDPSPLGQMMRLDARSFRTSSFRFDNAPEPEASFPFIAADALEYLDVVIDLRSEEEAPEPIHPSAARIAPDVLIGRLPMASTRLVLCCASGLRAWRMADEIYPDWPGEIVLVAASAS